MRQEELEILVNSQQILTKREIYALWMMTNYDIHRYVMCIVRGEVERGIVMAHLQLLRLEYGDVKVKEYHLKTLLRGLGYSSLTFEGDGMCNEWGNTYIVTKNGRYFTNSTMSTAVNWGKMCLTEDEFLNEAVREIRLFEKEEKK